MIREFRSARELLALGFSRVAVDDIRSSFDQEDIWDNIEYLQFGESRVDAALIADVAALQAEVDALKALVSSFLGVIPNDVMAPTYVDQTEFDASAIVSGVFDVVRIGIAQTGAQTATFTATNKPGSNTAAPTNWLTIDIGGTPYHIPLFGD